MKGTLGLSLVVLLLASAVASGPEEGAAAPTPGTARFRVTVYGPDGPVPGARVELLREGEVVGTAVADDGGVAFFPAAPARVELVARGSAPGLVGNTAPRVLPLGCLFPEMLSLHPAGVEPAALSGRVVSAADGKPIAGSRVELRGGHGYRMAEAIHSVYHQVASGETDAETKTGKNGEFRFADPPPASFRLFRIAAQGLRTTWAWQAPGATAIALAPGAAIRGRVTDGEGRPVAGARILAVPAFPAIWAMQVLEGGTCFFTGVRGEPWPVSSTLTDTEGRYVLDGLGRGDRYAVRVLADGFVSAQTEPVAPPATTDFRVETGATLSVLVKAPGREGVPDVRVTVSPKPFWRYRDGTTDENGRAVFRGLPPGPARVSAWPGPGETVEMPASGTVERVVEIPEAPVPKEEASAAGPHVLEGVVVRPDGASAGAGWANLFRWSRQTAVEADGSFRFELLPAGEAVLQVRCGTAVVERPVTIPGPALRVVLPWALGIRGTLVFPEEREITPLAFLKAEDHASDVLLAPADADGRRRTFEVPLRPGSKHVTIQVPGYLPIRWSGVLPEETALDLGELPLDPGRSVIGRIVDEADRPVPRAWVYADAHRGAMTDAEGRFRLAGLEEGPVRLTVAAPEFVERELVVTADAEELDIRLRPKIPLEIRVRNRDGDPVPRANVRLRGGEAGGSPLATTTGSDGAARISVPPGEWELTVTGFGAAGTTRRIEISRDRPPGRLDLTLDG